MGQCLELVAMGMWSLNVRGACRFGLQECETASERAEEKDCDVLELSSALSI